MNLNEKINMLYDFLYNDTDNYDIDNININNISVDDIRIPYGKLSKDIYKQLLEDSNFEVINDTDTTDNVIYYKRYSNTHDILIKINLLNEEKVNTDNLLSYILSYLVLTKQTQHILLPILNLNIKTKDLKKNKLFNNLIITSSNNKYAYIQLRESFENLIILKNFINSENIKIILFQIFHTLFVIYNNYPLFYHGRLNLDNIFVYTKNNINTEYKYNGITFNLPPNTNFSIKLANFYNSTINNTEDIEENEEENKTQKTIMNDIKNLSKNILKEKINLDLNTKNFLVKLSDMKNNNIESILNDKYFSEFNKINETRILKQDNFRGIKLKRFDITLDSDTSNALGKQKNINNRMNGGSDKTTVLPNNIKNNPFTSNDEKYTATKRRIEMPPPQEPPVLLEQKVYNPNPPAPSRPPQPPSFLPIYDANTQQIITTLPINHMYNPELNQPVQKVYNISLANPLHDYTSLRRVFEDILPGDPRVLSFNTTLERSQLINFVRNIIINNTDGEEMTITGGNNSLLSHIKLLNLNPYSLRLNPYEDLPKDFILYNAAYPIRYNTTKNELQNAKFSHGINVRIYNMTYGDLEANKIAVNTGNISNQDMSNVWRDIKYYTHMFENIVSKKKSPNFVSKILYKIDKLSNIDWNKLLTVQGKYNIQDNLSKQKNMIVAHLKATNKNMKIMLVAYANNNIFNEWSNMENLFKNNDNITIEKHDFAMFALIPKHYEIRNVPCIVIDYDGKYNIYNNSMLHKDILDFINNTILKNNLTDKNTPSGKSLVLLTEAPTTSFLTWASPIYEDNGSVKKMISTGYHDEKVWISIIFQIFHILYTLYTEKIFIRELSLKDNFFIKDLAYDPSTLNYWVYNVDGLDYYIPNYGYLVLFDTKYKDCNSNEFKIESSTLFNTNTASIDIDSENIRKTQEIFNTNELINLLKLNDSLQPNTNVINIITCIQEELNNPQNNIFESCFYKYFKNYLHNRIGTSLLKSEKDNINILTRPIPKKNKLLVNQVRYEEYEWVLYISQVEQYKHKILTLKNNNPIEKEVYTYSLLGYPDNETVQQKNINDIQLLEHYKNN